MLLFHKSWVIDESYKIEENLSVGRPITNTQVYIVNNSELCGFFEKGELCIAGNGLSAGYLNRPELTAEKFTASVVGNGKMYHTGDIARWMPDGKLEFFGRNDDQLKIRGHRIELTDIESVIKNVEDVSEAVVIARTNNDGEPVLNAYVISDKNLDINDITMHISKELPDYMIPPNMMQIDAIPFNSNGKLDKNLLPVIDNTNKIEYCAPRNETDAALIETFETVLDVSGIGIKHNFFALGGDSLKATLVVLYMKEKGYKLTASDILMLNSIMNISDKITSDSAVGIDEKSAENPVVVNFSDTSDYEKIYPLMNVQQGIYYHCIQEENSGSYIMQSLIKPIYMINPFHVMNALKLLIIKHEVLKTRIILNDQGEPVQAIARNSDIECNFLQASSEKELSELCQKEVERGFVLDSEPLMRVAIAGVGADMYYIWTIHHIISDGWSNAVIFNYFNSIYNKLASGVSFGDIKAESTVENSGKKCFSDYVSYIFNKDTSSAMEYWNDLLADYNGSCNIYSVEDIDSEANIGHYDSTELSLSAELISKLENTAKKAGVSLNTVFESAIGLLLQRYMTSNDIVFGKVSSGRDHDIDGIESMTGIFINTLPVRVTSAPDMKISELFSEVAKQSYTSEKYGICSIADIQNLTDQGRNLIKLLVAFENYYGNEDFSGQDGTKFISSREQTNYDMTLVIKVENGIKLQMIYAQDKFCLKDAELFLERAEKVLEEICDRADGNCGGISIYADDKEISELWVPYNSTAETIPVSTLQELFTEQVKATPDAVAVICYDESITYSALYNKACGIAEYLISNGAEKGDRIAVLGERKIGTIANMLGVLLAGCAYIPLNSDYPEERNRLIIESSGCKMTLKSDTTANVPAYSGKYEMVTDNTESVAYIIYTSGSTGTPKGVVIRQSAACNTIIDINRKFNIGQNDRILGLSSYCFDLSVYDIFGSLSTGAALVIVKDQRDAADIRSLVEKHGITFWNSVPAIMTLFLDMTDSSFRNDTLRHVLFSGDWIPLDLPERTERTFSNTDITSLGGATEGSIWSIYYPIENVKKCWRSIPYGRPLANQQMCVLDSSLRCCSVGMTGQICIGGTGVAEEYFNSAEQTSRSFVMHEKLGRIYLTGDSGRMRSDGNIEFLGRLDDQVKIRGFRVELGEIENVLKNVNEVQNAAVVVKTENRGENVLCAYLVSDIELDIQSVISCIRDRLPDYMIPSKVMQIDEIPLTSNGKLNKRALPEIDGKTNNEYIPPRNETEEKICAIFSEILDVEKVGINDSFFELGGHSLKATRLVNRIEEKTGVRIALKDVFSHATPEQLAKLAGATGGEEYVPIPKASEKEYYPMSSAQKRTYLIQQLSPESTVYNMPAAIRLKGNVRHDDLRLAFQQMIDRHEILRTQFLLIDGETVQKILTNADVDFEYATSGESDEELMKNFIRPFDLGSGKPVRVKLVNKGEYYLMMFDMHHIVSDGMSMNTFSAEVMKLYNGEKLEPLTHQYKDYSEWMRTRDLSGQKEYWVSQFSDEIPVLDMPTDYPRPQKQSYNGSTISCEFDEKFSSSIKSLVKKTGTTEYMVFLAALMVTLSKYSRQEDIVIGSPISGRTHRDTESMLGMFVNTLAMRGKPENNKTFSDFLAEIKETCLKAYENQEYPFEELVEAVEVQRDTSRNPIFDVLLIMQNNETTELKLNGSENENADILNKISKFDMTFNLTERNGKYNVVLEYCIDLFKEETAKGILAHFIEVVKNMSVNAVQKIGEIDMTTAEERALILNDFNATETEYPREKTIVELFEEQVNRTPDNTAFVFEDEKQTYLEFNARANALAYKLREVGVKPDDLVAIIADRSIEMVCGIYGIIKAGGAYVPIDPTYPEERISFIIEDSKPKAVLKFTTESISISFGIPVIDLKNSEVWEGVSENPEHVNTPNDLIYCIYTSGTTGKPKGVMLQNSSVVNYCYRHAHSVMNYAYKNNLKTILSVTNMVFDIFVTELHLALINGYKIILATSEEQVNPDKLGSLISRYKPEIMQSTPSRIKMMLSGKEGQNGLAQFSYIMLGGEKVERSLINNLKKYTSAVIEDVYGPTETTVWSSCCEIDNGAEQILIGKPISNTKIYVEDNENLCGIGVPGELCIAGDGLARGYLNRPELTAEKFVKNLFGEGIMYRTGDLARWLSDGNIEYLGRIDEQVKIRGFRIELGEIESRIREIEDVRDCAVIARADASGEKSIYAYYTSDSEVSVSEIRSKLSESLPEYMVPSYMMQIDSFPVNKNGKLDKKALPEIEARTTKEYVAPRNETEEKICEIFSEILNIERVGINDSFFELGGHSLKATKLVNRIEEKIGVRIALKDMFSHTTPEQLAKLADAAGGEEYEPIPKASPKEYYPMSSAQKRTYLIQQLSPESTVYNMPAAIRLTGDVRPDDLRSAFQKVIDRHEILRTKFLMINGEPVQKILDHVEADFECCSSEREDNELIEEHIRPFDLSVLPLIHTKLIKKKDYSLLLFDMHHIISDALSAEILISELMTLYSGGKLDEITYQFKDYSEWIRTRDLSRQKNYWVSQFDDVVPVLDLPTDFSRPMQKSNDGAGDISVIDSDIVKDIRKLAAETGTTEYMVFLTSYMVMLSKYSRQDDITVGTPVSGRTNRDTETMLGMFVNTLVMRGQPENNKTFMQFLNEIKDICLKAYENQDYPFEELVDDLNISRDISRNSLFDVMMNVKSNADTAIHLDGISAEYVNTERRTSKCDILFDIYPENDSYKMCIEYCTALFKPETIKRMSEHFRIILKCAVADPERKIGSIEMITPAEKELITGAFNITDANYPRNKTIADLFEEQAARTPDNIAVVFENSQLTYRELNEAADKLAGRLIEKGVKSGDYVAMFIERSLEMIIGIYGIIKAGGVYVPINTMYPDDRVAYILNDCGAKLLLTGETELNVEFNGERINLKTEEAYGNPTCVKTDISPDNGLYVIYTSGTTGLPKGVEVMHKNVVRLMFNDHFDYDFNENDVWTMFHSYGFDFSVWEMYGATLYGGKLIVVSEETAKDADGFIDLLKKHKVTVLNQVPTAFYNLMSADKGDKLFVRYLIFGGEALNPKKLVNWRKYHLETTIVNMYGITETTVHVTYRVISDKEIERGISDIGRAIPTLKVFVMNGNAMCGIGVPGELCVTGDGLAKGYLNKPELTAAKFVENPFGEGKMYRSGDLVRWLADGNIEYLGRIDDQVKIRGFRIELGEIESRIREIRNINDCAVIVRNDTNGEKAIYAYYTGDAEVGVSEIRESLSVNLPNYMIPAYMMQIDSIPVTRNGKLDRRALPEIEVCPAKAYSTPRNKTEERICEIFSEILGVEKVGINDSFFELGGHSLKATKLVNRIEERTGIRIALKDVFSYTTPEQLAKLVGADGREQFESIPKASPKEYYPMSSAQKRMYYINQMQPEATAYNISFAVRITGNIDIQRMADSVQKLVDNNEILRTSFITIDSVPIQKIYDSVQADYEYISETSLTDEQLIASFVKPFDLSVPKLLRVRLYERGEYKLMLMDMHHIISDGMSMYNFVSELSDIYNGNRGSSNKLQFKDYSEWFNNTDLSEHKKFWAEMFSGDIPVIDIPADHTRPTVQQYNGAKTNTSTDADTSRKISEFIAERGVTAYMFFMSALMILLSKYSRQDDIIVGSPITGRTHKDTEKMLGMFVNTIAMRGAPSEKKEYNVFLDEISKKCVDAYEHQNYPFEELIDKLDIDRDMSRNPLFDVMFAFQNFEIPEMKLGDAETEVEEISENNTKFDLTFSISETNGIYNIILEYCTDIYCEHTAENMLAHFTALIENIIAAPDTAIGKLEMISPEEKNVIINKFNDTAADYPYDSNIAEALQRQAAKTPDKTAVVFNNESITYAELDRSSNIIANKLKEQNVGKDDFIIIMTRKCIETIIGICGIVKAGAAYVPIDPSYLEERLDFIIKDCKPKAIMRFSDMTSVNLDIPCMLLDSDELLIGDDSPLENAASPDSLIYCIYTSGTTGKPKGVLIEHISVLRLVFNCDYTELNEDSRIIQTGQLSFDASTFEIWGALLNGGTLFLVEQSILLDAQALKKYLIRNNINIMFITTALFNQLLNDDPKVFNSLDHLMFGGEATSESHVEKLRRQHTVPDFRNVYGPTETTTFATHYIINHEAEKTPIGKPISNTQTYIIDAGHLCGIGIPGELCIAGPGLARGYLNRPELTDEKFIFNEELGKRIYCSGDLARWLPDGNIEYLGRVDNQIKIRGFRIELGEIENRIREVDGVTDCVVVVRNDQSGDKTIYAYYTSLSPLSENQLRDALATVLPDYMIPSYIMNIEELPFNNNGKVDKKLLPDICNHISREYEAPVNENETVLCKAVENILNTERVGRNDRFFEIGGDSIKAIRIVTMLKKEGYELSVKDIIRSESLRSAASAMKKITEETNNDGVCVTGNVTHMPTVSMFKEFDLEIPNYFHQSVVLKCIGDLDTDTVIHVLDIMTKQHDALRAVYNDGTLFIREYEERKMFCFNEYDISDLSEIPDICDELRSKTDIHNGNMLTSAIFRNGSDSYLFIAVHHLVIDGVSWRILLNDIIDMYEEIQEHSMAVLPHKTASLIDWNNKLEKYINSEEYETAKKFWFNELDADSSQYVPTEKSGYGGKITFSLSRQQTEKLIYNANHAYNTDTRDLLLAALAETLKNNLNQDSTVVGLEHNGRNDFGETIDINSTVCWFTVLYPMNISFTDDMCSQIVNIKEKLRSISGHELDYSLMRYITHDIDDAEYLISWNYHGIADEQNMLDKKLRLDEKLNTGNDIPKENDFLSPIIINLIITSGMLNVEILYKDIINDEEIKDFADSYKNNINAVIEHCSEVEDGFKTLSDFDVELDDANELNNLIESLDL